MAEQTETKRDLSELLLAMDVVDTLRHEQALVQRELQSQESEAALIEKLRSIYTGQGIEVSDEVLMQGVRALREERFAYHPPPSGFKTTLARLYVARGRWGKRATMAIVALLVIWGGYHFLYAGPAAREKTRIVAQADAIGAEAVREAMEPAARKKAEALRQQALSAMEAGDVDTARTALASLQGLRELLRHEYTLQVVSRPGTPSGVWRHPVSNPAGRNYYLVVEAITADGRRLALPVVSEEDGKVQTVTVWGLRVPPEVYEQVRMDKERDGIVDERIVGLKRPGHITPQYRIEITGGAITAW
jgi:hypothetical protein